MMRRKGSLLGVIGAVLLGVALTACGYSTGSLVSRDYRTIAVPIFDNTTTRHDLEFEVTRAVVEELQSRTHLRVVAPEDNPDLLMRGSLVKVNESSLSRQRHQRPRDAVVFVTANVTVTNERTGENVVAGREVTERETYSPLVGESIRTAREESVRALAERIVQTLETEW